MQKISSSAHWVCPGRTRKVFDLQSQRGRNLVPVFNCPAFKAYVSDRGAIDYRDVDLTAYLASDRDGGYDMILPMAVAFAHSKDGARPAPHARNGVGAF